MIGAATIAMTTLPDHSACIICQKTNPLTSGPSVCSFEAVDLMEVSLAIVADSVRLTVAVEMEMVASTDFVQL